MRSRPKRADGQAIVGYRASNRVTIKMRDVTKVASVIDMLVGAGANEIGGINFIVTQPSKALDEAREKAIADARRKAEIYAKAAGVTLGEPISISEEGAAAPVFRSKMAAPMAVGAPVAQGEETLSVSVNVSWAIKPKRSNLPHHSASCRESDACCARPYSKDGARAFVIRDGAYAPPLHERRGDSS